MGRLIGGEGVAGGGGQRRVGGGGGGAGGGRVGVGGVAGLQHSNTLY